MGGWFDLILPSSGWYDFAFLWAVVQLAAWVLRWVAGSDGLRVLVLLTDDAGCGEFGFVCVMLCG